MKGLRRLLASLAMLGVLLATVAPATAATKLLYPYDSGALTRTPQPATNTGGSTIASKGGVKNYTLAPAITAANPLVLTAGTITVTLVSSSASATTLNASLWNGATPIGSASLDVASATTPTAKTYSITLNSDYTLSSGSLVLRVTNSNNGNNKDATVYQYNGTRSQVSFATSTFVNVDTLAAYSVMYPSTATLTAYAPSNSVFIRATVSDPFGAADITAAKVTITDPNAVVKANAITMTNIVASTATTKTFEYEYALPSNAAAGTWNASVTALEGTEGSVTATKATTFAVATPSLTISKSHAADFTAGTNGTYAIVVHNGGGSPVSGTTTVTDAMPTGLSFVSGSGSGWTCGSPGATATCTSTNVIAGGADFPTLTLTVAAAGSAGASVNNVAKVSNPAVNGGVAINSNTDTTTIRHPDLSTSTNFVADQDGGDAEPGDVLRYTITLVESAGAAASGVSVTSDIPAGVTGFNVVDAAGGVNASVVGGGANATGYLDITGISLAAGGSASIVFEVTVGAGAVVGDTIDDTATIANPNGTGASVQAPTVTILQSQVAAGGNKLLYIYDNLGLTRTPQPATTSAGVSVNAGTTRTWTLAPAIPVGQSLVLSAGTIAVNLAADTAFSTVTIQARLFDGATQVGSTATRTFSTSAVGNQQFSITLASDYTLAANRQLTLQLTNTAGGNKNLTVYQYNGSRSTIGFATSTVVAVESVAVYAAPYPATTTKAFYAANEVAYVRAVVSDPFGSGDVGGAVLTVTDGNGVPQVNGLAMSEVNDSGVDRRTYEYAVTLPPDAVTGFWTTSVTGHEGTEGTVTDVMNGSFGVGVAQLTLAKSHSGDFTAGMNGTYSLVVHNNGSPVTGLTTVVDTLPSEFTYVSGGGSGGWTCTPSGQVVTCTNDTDMDSGDDLPTLSLTVLVSGSAGTSVNNLATLSNPDVDSGTPQNSNNDATTILHPDLSTSTYLVADQDGGDAEPGDVLRYTITLVESAGAAASGVSVNTDMPAGVTGFNVINAGGGTDVSVIGGGANSTGRLDITGIGIPANGSASIVFEITVSGTAVAADTIDNTVTIGNPNGTGASVAAPTVTVLQSQVALGGNKLLYIYDNLSLTRTPQPTTASAGISVNSGATQTWTLAPAIPTGQSLVLSAGTIAVNLAVNTNFNTLNIEARLFDGATQVGATSTQNFSTTGVASHAFSISLGSDYTLVAGRQLTLQLTNTTGGNKNLTVYQYNGSRSTIGFATSTVVSVDSVAAYDAVYPATTTRTYYVHNDVLRIRAVVSDPFGSADVGGAEVTITDPNGATVVAATAMAEVDDSGVDTRTYEYAFQVPMQAVIGTWTASILAHEGTEGTVTDTANGAFDVRGRIEFDHAWVNATAGDAVSLAISGATDAVAGSSTAPTPVVAATAASVGGATITLDEAFTTGVPGDYTVAVACSKDSDDSALAVAGVALSRTFTMPTDSSVTCVWTNTKSVPLTVVKLSTVYSDPVNGTTNPKAIPGAVVEYQVIVTNTSSVPVDSDTILLSDVLDGNLVFQVTDIDGPGSGPVKFVPGASGLSYTFTSLASTTDDVEFSIDGGGDWNHPASDTGGGVDAAVDAIRINPKGMFIGGGAQFKAMFRVRIK